MTWAKLDDKFHHDPRLVRLSRDTRLLYVEGLTYCAQQLTDGFIADYMLRKITDSPDPDGAAQALVDGGLWELATHGRDKGWEVVGYLANQSSREDVERSRALSAETTARSRRHKAGDHSTCIKGRYCPDGAVTRHDSRQSSSQSGLLEPTLSDPTPGGEERRSGTASPTAGAAGTRPLTKKKNPGGGFTVTMPDPVAEPFVFIHPGCDMHGLTSCGCTGIGTALSRYRDKLLAEGVPIEVIQAGYEQWQAKDEAAREAQAADPEAAS